MANYALSDAGQRGLPRITIEKEFDIKGFEWAKQ